MAPYEARASGARSRGSAETIERAPDAAGAAVQDVGVNHRRGDVTVAQQRLDGPYVVARFER
jgi:hypothetical protein